MIRLCSDELCLPRLLPLWFLHDASDTSVVRIDLALGTLAVALSLALELVSGCVLWLRQFLVFLAADPVRFWRGSGEALALALVSGCVLWLGQFLAFFAADPLRFWRGLGAALGVRRLAEAHPKRLRVLLLPLPLSVPLLPHSAPQTERLLVEAPMVALTISPRSVSFQYRAGQLGGSGRMVAVFRCT